MLSLLQHGARRGVFALGLAYLVALKLVLASALVAPSPADRAVALSVICHAAPGAPADAPVDPLNCHDDCCLLRAAVLFAPSLVAAFLVPSAPMSSPTRPRPWRHASAAPPFEAWSPVRAQRGPPLARA